jgi:hypothetical protein
LDPSVVNFSNRLKNEEKKRALNLYFNYLLQTARKHGHIVGAIDNGKLLGAGTYYLPGELPLPLSTKVKNFMALFPPFGLKQLYRLTRKSALVDKAAPAKFYVYPELGCVWPQHRKAGVITHILNDALHKADKLGVGAYADTSNYENIPIWQKFDFRVIKEMKIYGVSYFCLWREPHT